jgi:hypothetical protein
VKSVEASDDVIPTEEILKLIDEYLTTQMEGDGEMPSQETRVLFFQRRLRDDDRRPANGRGRRCGIFDPNLPKAESSSFGLSWDKESAGFMRPYKSRSGVVICVKHSNAL